MASLKSALKRIPLLHKLGKALKSMRMDLSAVPCFLEERKLHHGDGPIRVGFLCQYIPAWSKMEGVYKKLQTDPRFSVFLICLPSGISGRKLQDPDCLDNDIYSYCLNNGYPEAINALVAKNTFLDLKELDLHYLFYPRPYNHMMPPGYGTKEVSRFCRTCLIMYGVEFSEDISFVSLNRNFFANNYYYFAEFPFMQKRNIRNNRLGHFLKLQKTECHGYPMFEHLLQFQGQPSPSWEFTKSNFRVLWTPRWNTDTSIGGSNFFTYYQALPDFAEKNPDMAFLLRPHPLTFSNFIETGEMTQEDVDAYKNRCAAMDNLCIDTAPNYEATLWQTSVMISDISSIMPEYFITGNPLIFCASNMFLKLTDFMERMLEGCYIVNNKEELFDCLQMLYRGEDPLKAERQKIIAEQFGASMSGACDNIMEALVRDHQERKC